MSPAMTAAAVGALAVLLCVVALRAARRERFGPALLCLFLLGLALRAYMAADFHLHEWDERYHVLVAKHLVRHPLRPTLYEDPVLPYDPRESFANHVWLHKPPLALWTLAVGVRLFSGSEPLLRLPSVVFSSLAVLMTYALGRRLFDRRAALAAAFLHAVSGFLIDLAAGRRASDHVDSLFVCLVEAGVLLAFVSFDRGHPFWLAVGVGLLTGLAALTKAGPALLILAVWGVLLVWHPDPPARRRAARVATAGLAVATLVALPWFLYVRAAFPREFAWESSYVLRHLTEPLEGHAGTALSHLVWMPRLFGELVYLPVLWFLWRTARGDARPERVALAVWLLLPYAVFSFVATKMPGYVMIAAPAVFLVVGALASQLWAAPEGAWRRSRLVLAGLLLLLPVRYTLDRMRPLLTDDRRRPWSEGLRRLERSLGAEPCVIFGVERAIEAMFYTHCTAYPRLPAGPAVVERLEKAGYRVLVLPWS